MSKEIDPGNVAEAKKEASHTCNENDREFESMTNLNSLAATIIASITYSVAMQVPGGYNTQGMANLNGKTSFRNFVEDNSLAFRSSAGTIMMCLMITFSQKKNLPHHPRTRNNLVINGTIHTYDNYLLFHLFCSQGF